MNKTPHEVEETREHVKLDLKNEEQNVKFRLLKQRSGWTDCSLMDINQFGGGFYEVGVSLVIHSLKTATKLGLTSS